MRILLVGAGGVGKAFARIAARRPFAELAGTHYLARERPPGSAGRDQVSARMWLSTLAVFATGSAWRQSCSMTSR